MSEIATSNSYDMASVLRVTLTLFLHDLHIHKLKQSSGPRTDVIALQVHDFRKLLNEEMALGGRERKTPAKSVKPEPPRHYHARTALSAETGPFARH